MKLTIAAFLAIVAAVRGAPPKGLDLEGEGVPLDGGEVVPLEGGAEDQGRDLAYYGRGYGHGCSNPTGCCAWSHEAVYCGTGRGKGPGHKNACDCKHGGMYLPGCEPKTDYVPGCCYKPDHHGHGAGLGTCGNELTLTIDGKDHTIPGRYDCASDIDETRCVHAGGCYCPRFDKHTYEPLEDEEIKTCMEKCGTPEGGTGCCGWDPYAKFCSGGTFGFTEETCWKAGGYFNPNVDTSGYYKNKCVPEGPPGHCFDKKSCKKYWDFANKKWDWKCSPYSIPKGCECSISEKACHYCDGKFKPGTTTTQPPPTTPEPTTTTTTTPEATTTTTTTTTPEPTTTTTTTTTPEPTTTTTTTTTPEPTTTTTTTMTTTTTITCPEGSYVPDPNCAPEDFLIDGCCFICDRTTMPNGACSACDNICPDGLACIEDENDDPVCVDCSCGFCETPNPQVPPATSPCCFPNSAGNNCVPMGSMCILNSQEWVGYPAPPGSTGDACSGVEDNPNVQVANGCGCKPNSMLPCAYTPGADPCTFCRSEDIITDAMGAAATASCQDCIDCLENECPSSDVTCFDNAVTPADMELCLSTDPALACRATCNDECVKMTP